MTPRQRKRANALIRRECCNYDSGNCLWLDDGEEHTCPQSISYSVNCKWFRRCVLPQDKPLEAEIFHSGDIKRCAVCGAAFIPKSNRAKYCENAPRWYIGSKRQSANENGGQTWTNRSPKSP